MGFGGANIGTVNVDLVQTDVQAIVDGITGNDHRTLTDIDNHLQTIGGYLCLFDGYSYTSISDQLNSLRGSMDLLISCLRNDYIGRTAIDSLMEMENTLNDIRNNTSH
jgi:hypothetical protein